MSTNGSVSTTLLDWQAPPALGLTQTTAAVTRVRYLERQVFDDSGRQRRGVTESEVQGQVSQINQLRQLLGWLEIDLLGQWRWPN